MNIPDKIKIGSKFYDVSISDKVLLLDREECGGLIDYEQMTIELNDQRSKQKVEHNCLHEIVHAICRDRDINFEDNEKTVESFAKGLHALIVDNPDIFK